MTLYLVGALFVSAIILSLPIFHLIRLRTARRYPPTTQFSVAVIVPCKGNDDPDFENNLVSIIQQDYQQDHQQDHQRSVQFVFCAESEHDSAVPTLRLLEQRFPHVQVCIAGLSTRCSQKTFNILKGMEQVEETDVFVIADADIQPHTTWLQELVGPFVDPQVGAATGFFRRIPMTGQFRLGDYLAGLFASIIIIGVSDDLLKSLWGGSLAVRKATMDRYQFYERLATEIVDDMAIMHALHKHGIKRRYVQSCTLKSYCDMSVSQSIEWFIRQIQFLQIYFKELYTATLALIWAYVFYMATTPLVLVYGLFQQRAGVVAVCLLFWLLLFGCGALLYRGTPFNPTNASPQDPQYRLLPWLLTTPLAFVHSALSMTRALFRVKNGILCMRWRQITYHVDVRTGKVVEIIR